MLEAAAGAVNAMPNLRTLVFLGLADTVDHACLFTVMISLEPYVFECENTPRSSRTRRASSCFPASSVIRRISPALQVLFIYILFLSV